MYRNAIERWDDGSAISPEEISEILVQIQQEAKRSGWLIEIE